MEDHHAAARQDIEYANDVGEDDAAASFLLLRSVAHSLISITIYLERIDDALRNTIGGRS